MRKRALKNCIQTAAALGLVIAVWAIAYFCAGNELLVPAPLDCVKEIGRLLRDGGFWKGAAFTLGRVLSAFVLSFAAAGGLAVLAYAFPSVGRCLSPIVSLLRTLPTLAAALVILVWWGAAVAPVVVAFLSLFPMLYAGIAAALSQVDRELIEMSRVYKTPLKKRIAQLYLPSAAPYVLREAGAAVSFSLKLVVSAEVLAATYKSLGGMMQEAKIYLDIPSLFALVCITAAFGATLEAVCAAAARAVERRVR